MTNKQELLSNIEQINKGLQSSKTPENLKVGLRKVLADFEKQLADLKEDKAEPAEKPSSVAAVNKMSKDELVTAIAEMNAGLKLASMSETLKDDLRNEIALLEKDLAAFEKKKVEVKDIPKKKQEVSENQKLINTIKGIEKDIEISSPKIKKELTKSLVKAKKELKDLPKIVAKKIAEKSKAEKKEKKAKKVAVKKVVEKITAKKTEKVAVKKVEKKSGNKSVLDDCKEILKKYKLKKANDAERIEERAKKGKPAVLTPSETIQKSAQAVKGKILDMKDKGISKSEVSKLSTGIIATVKSTLAGILDISEKHKFIKEIISELNKVNSSLPKSAEHGGYMADGGRTTAAINRDRAFVYEQEWEQEYHRKTAGKRYQKRYELGGEMENENAESLMGKINELDHHLDEISKIVNEDTEIEPWVLTRAQRAATDLSDITHYLESESKKGDTEMEYGGMFADGGNIDNLAEISNISGNIMGTTSFDLKLKGMRKPQDFIVYPISKSEAKKPIMIQSDKRIGMLDLDTGEGLMSQNHANGAYFIHLQLDKKTSFKISEDDLNKLKQKIIGTTGESVGSVIVSDNEGAGMMEKGGRYNTGRAWTLDHYQHNKSEDYEVPLSEREYADGGSIGQQELFEDGGDISIPETFSVTFKYEVESEDTRTVKIKANSREEAEEIAKAKYGNSYDDFEIIDVDCYECGGGIMAKGGETEKKYTTLWYAVGQKGMDWDKHPQETLNNLTWKQAVKKVNEISEENKAQVRLSTSEGYNNQGYYFYHKSMEDGGSVMAKGGNVPSIEKKVKEVNRLIELGNENKVEVVDESGSWQAPTKWKPFKYSNGTLYMEYDELDLYRHNKRMGTQYVNHKDKVLKSNMEFDGIPTLNDVAKQYRKALKAEGVLFEAGGATFDDKVRAISKKLVGEKVPSRLKKDYGSKYDKKESIMAAKRIAGAIVAKNKNKK